MSNCKFVRKWTTVIVRVNDEAGLLGPARDRDRQPTRQEDLGKVPGIEWSVVHHGGSTIGFLFSQILDLPDLPDLSGILVFIPW